MLNVTNSFGTVFQVEENEKYVGANFATSRKKPDGTYEHFSWRTRFVGETFEAAKALQDKDRVRVTNGLVEGKYDKETGKTYVTLIVFAFEKVERPSADAE